MRKVLFVVCTLALSSCKVVVQVPPGGEVSSNSGAYTCASGETCEIQFTDFFFDETFTAFSSEGQQFLGWKRQLGGLCGGTTTECELSTIPLGGNDAVEQFLKTDAEFYLEPVFGPLGGPSFNLRYCEVLIGRLVDGVVEAEVWSSQGLNDCPESNVRALDPAEIAEDNGALWANINGPRYWVIDNLQLVGVPPGFRALEDIRQEFGGIEMRLITSIKLATSGTSLTAGGAYRPGEVARDTRFTFLPGRRVYELAAPNGRRYLMQSFSQAVRKRQHITELVDLGGRLELPEEWRFHSYTLEEEFQLLSVDGVAEVVTDNLANTYQFIPE